MSDEAPKSALELAMERLRRQDAEAGVAETPLTEAQKAEIAEIRQVVGAKLAETEILHRAALATTWDPAERAKLEDEHRRDVQRLHEERERKIGAVRARG